MDSKRIWHSNSDDQAENIATVGQAISYIEEAKNNNLPLATWYAGVVFFKINSRLTFNQKIFIVIPIALLTIVQ
jgi:hypothetical protein